MTRASRSGRGGFTSVELLVVVGIIAILVSMTIGAVLRFRGVGPQMATQSTIKVIKALTERQWKGVADKADEEVIPPGIQATVDTLAAGDSFAAPRARVLFVKLRLKHCFPVSFAEVYNPYTPPFAVREYQAYLTNLGITSTNYNQPAVTSVFTAEMQNAICLLMALEIGPGGSGTASGELSGLTMTLGTSPTGKDVRGLVDGWRNPLILCRFPTSFAPPLEAGRDPVDPQNYLNAVGWRASGNRILANAAVGHNMPINLKLMPVVASVGKDGLLGLNPTTFAVTNAAETQDNKYTTDY